MLQIGITLRSFEKKVVSGSLDQSCDTIGLIWDYNGRDAFGIKIVCQLDSCGIALGRSRYQFRIDE